MMMKRFRRKSSKSTFTLKRLFGFKPKCIIKKDKDKYLDELRKIYDVIKQHKHYPDDTLTIKQFHDVSPDYILHILTDIHKQYNWSLVYSVPSSENTFLKAVIRIADRILRISDITQQHKHPSSKFIQPSIRSDGTLNKSSTSIFDKLCKQLNLSTNGTKSYYIFAPNDECMNQPFYKTYFQSISENTFVLKSLLQHHFIPVGKLLNKNQFTITSALGYPITIVHNNQHIEKVNNALVVGDNMENKKYIIDSVLGLHKPFGLTVFQKKVIQTRVTSICMLFSKNYCTSPCTMGTLTCSYSNGGSSSIHSDMNYLKQFVIQTIREYFITDGLLYTVSYVALPIIEHVIGNVSLVNWTRSFLPLLAAPLIQLSKNIHYASSLFFPMMAKITGISINKRMFSPIIIAPILEECLFRGAIKEGIEKIINVYPPPKQQSVKTYTSKSKNKKQKNKLYSRRRQSSNFEDILKDDEIKYSNQLAYWATTLFVSLWFALIHIRNHASVDERVFVNRWSSFVHIIVCMVCGVVCHTLTTHRGILVSILRHTFENLLCRLLPNVFRTHQLMSKTPPNIAFELPRDPKKWCGVQLIDAFFTSHDITTMIRLHFPKGCKPNRPINNLGIEYPCDLNSDSACFQYTTIPQESAQLSSRIEVRCSPTLEQARGY